MSLSPLPNHLILLPPAFITIPPGSDTSPGLPQLKLKIVPYLLIATPLLSVNVTGRRLEECVEVLVPVGGSVSLGLEINVEALISPAGGLQAETQVEMEVEKRVGDVFRRVSRENHS